MSSHVGSVKLFGRKRSNQFADPAGAGARLKAALRARALQVLSVCERATRTEVIDFTFAGRSVVVLCRWTRRYAHLNTMQTTR